MAKNMPVNHKSFNVNFPVSGHVPKSAPLYIEPTLLAYFKPDGTCMFQASKAMKIQKASFYNAKAYLLLCKRHPFAVSKDAFYKALAVNLLQRQNKTVKQTSCKKQINGCIHGRISHREHNLPHKDVPACQGLSLYVPPP